MLTCPNGHPNPDQAKFCSVCGVVLQVQQVAPPDQSPAMPSPAMTPASAGASAAGFAATTAPFDPSSQIPTNDGRSKKVIGLAVGGGVLGLVVLVLLVVVLRGGENFEPMTRIQAERALISSSELTLNFVLEEDDSSIEENKAYDPDLERDCVVVAGVRRLTDIPPTFSLGAPAFPMEARDITVFAGVDFKNPQDRMVTTLDERIMVFSTAEEATAYVDEIERALAVCPRANRGSSGDGFAFQLDDRYENVLRYDDNRTLTYDVASTFQSESDSGLLDIGFTSRSKVMIVQRGPNIMVADWYLDEDDRITPSELDAELEVMRTKFIESASGN
jgi:hypothetical protein